MYLVLLSVLLVCFGHGECDDRKQFTVANQEFAFDLYKSLGNSVAGKNVIFSPISISTALAMVRAGAAGNTKSQLSTALHLDTFGDDDQEIKKQYRSLLTALKDIPKNNFTVTMANAIFGRKDDNLSFQENFLQDISTNFLGAADTLNFGNYPEEARKHINKYVAENTNQLIKDLFPPNSISSQTSLVIVNAIYFKGVWENQFKCLQTHNATFHVSKTKDANVEMLSMSNEVFNYFADETLKCQVIELPYVSDKAAMYVILPTDIDGLASVEQQLTPTKLNNIVRGFEKKNINSLKLPKFVIKQDIALVEFLKKLGIIDMFAAALANLSSIYEQPVSLVVSEVLHKAYIGVDEAGTEAAAATGIVISRTSAITGTGPKLNFIADHPFMFLIVEKETNNILFMGRMTSPPTGEERIGTFAAQQQESSATNVAMPTLWLAVLGLMCLLRSLI